MRTKINMQTVYSMASDRLAVMSGNVIFSAGGVSEVSSEYEANADIISARVADGADGTHDVKVFIDIRTNNVVGHMCQCEHHTVWRGACAHVVALLMVLAKDSYSPPMPAPKLSDALIRRFEDDYLARHDYEYGAADEPVKLYPALSLDYDETVLSFTLGRRKRYVLQSLTDFFNKLDNGYTARYGRELTFKHRLSAFDARSAKLIGALRRTMDTAGEMVVALGRGGNCVFERNIMLTRRLADELFDIYLGDTIAVSLPTARETDMPVTDEPPPIGFTVDYEDGLAVIGADVPEFYTLPGERHSYFISGSIHVVDSRYLTVVEPLLQALKTSRNKKLCVSKDKTHSFVTAVLPSLRELGVIEREAAPPEDFTPLTVQFYLDAHGQHLRCKAVFRYGETLINPLERPIPAIPRDYIKERRVLDFLSGAGFKENPPYFSMADHDDIYGFYDKGLDEAHALAEIYTGAGFARMSDILTKAPRIGVRFEGSLIELTFDADYTPTELLEALESYRAKRKYHRLKDGRYIDLAAMGEAEKILGAFEYGQDDIADGVIRLPKYRALYLNSILESGMTTVAEVSPQLTKLAADITAADGAEPVQVMSEVLWAYQKTGYRWLRSLAAYGFGGILADEMGLGKTVQIIALLLAELREFTNPKPSIVIAPTSLVYNWLHEINRFAPELTAVTVVGAPTRRRALLQSPAHVYITTYDTLKRDIDAYKGMSFKYAVADEAQYLKNPATRNASAIKKLAAESRFALTGTPIENSLSELWSIFDFIMPGYLYSYSKFSRRFETPIVKHDDTQTAHELKRQIAPFILRRLKKDVLSDLPDKVETNLYAEMEDEQRKLYAAYMKTAMGELDSADNMQILLLLTRLRQICCHPRMFSEDYTAGSGKLELALDTLKSATESGHRVLLFSQFTTMLSIIIRRLKEAGISYFYLDGETPAADRLSMANRFNAGEREVFVISLKAGGTGLNLIGANIVMHYDPWWNPAVMDQASDRAHRYGQDKTVQVINLITRDSIEERIMALQERKRGLVDSVMTEGGKLIGHMSIEELRELFRD